MRVDVSRVLDGLAAMARMHDQDMREALKRAAATVESGGVPLHDLRDATACAVALAVTRDTIETVTRRAAEAAKLGHDEPDMLRHGA